MRLAKLSFTGVADFGVALAAFSVLEGLLTAWGVSVFCIGGVARKLGVMDA